MSPVAVHDRKGLGAPVARTGRGPRPIEKAAIYAYRAGAWLMGRLPVPVARGIVSVLLQVSFLLWPKKRRFVNDNFAHILGRPAGPATQAHASGSPPGPGDAGPGRPRHAAPRHAAPGSPGRARGRQPGLCSNSRMRQGSTLASGVSRTRVYPASASSRRARAGSCGYGGAGQ